MATGTHSALTRKRKVIESSLGAFALGIAHSRLSRKSPVEAERIGERWGRLLFKVSKKHRERALANFQLAMPELSESKRLDLTQKVFEHFGRVTADFMLASKRSREELEEQISVEGIEHLDHALTQSKGVILITGHFGNWERMSALLSYRGYPLSVVARDTRNEAMNEMLRRAREHAGTKAIPRGNAAKPMLQCLRNNELIGILPDQNSDEIFIPFFGHPAGTVLGPGVLHERTGAPVLCCFCARVGVTKYRFWIEPPLIATGSYETKGEAMMRTIHGSLETAIRAYPEQWLWFHDRWRSAKRAGLI